MKPDELLRGARVDATWLDDTALRRTATLRRRRRWSIAGTAAVLAAAAVVVPVVAWPSSSGPVTAAHVTVGARLGDGLQLVADEHPAPLDPASTGPVARAEQALTVSLLRQLVAHPPEGGDGNLSTSPASLAIALAMLQNGAHGATLDQIRKTLHSVGLSTEQQDAGWQALTAAWEQAAAAGKITLSSANSLFVQKGFPIRPAFLSALGSYYGSGVWQVDFDNHVDAAIDTINQWTSQQTHGKITKLFEDGQIDRSTVAVLANAIYFKAAWSRPFDPATSYPGTFYGSSKQSTPTFMEQTGSTLPWAVGDGYQAVELPYTGGRFAALAVMPTAGSLARFVAGLSPDRLAGIAAALHTGAPAKVALPRFTTTAALDLKATLRALGMPVAFTDGADFPALSPVPTKIQAVEQRVYLAVGEKGTEAAAATGIAMQPVSAIAGTSLTFDHPFLFLVRDTRTGAVLFASLVQNPHA
jgi:serpin B